MLGGLRSVGVNLGERSYSILIQTGLLSSLSRSVIEQLHPTHALVVCDRAVTSIANQLTREFEAKQIRCSISVIPSGETSKSVEQLERLWQEFQSAGADRKSIVVAVGGGVVGDLAGFAAASYMRGLRLVQVPTTLLSMVDSSVGGKTGINLAAGKNLVGAFWQPSLVGIDPQVLATLPEREYVSGLAEVVKYGVIGNAEFFASLESAASLLLKRDAATLVKVVGDCCRAKADVVEKDEYETSGLRASLNYGHTFAHAFERVYGYGQLLHGEAVSIGMTCAARLAAEMGLWSPDYADRQEQLLRALGLPVWLTPNSIDSIVDAMSKDKKVAHGRLKFVLPTALGKVELVDNVDMQRVREVLRGAMLEG